MKKVFAILLAAAMLIACMGVMVLADGPQQLVTKTGLYELRNNFPGWVGGIVRVGEKDLSVTSLGRMIYKGNSGTHEIKLVDARTNEAVPGAIAVVDTSQGTEGEYLYAALTEPVTLLAGQKYYLLSNEVMDGDMWAEVTSYATTADAAFCGTAFYLDNNYNPGEQEGCSFVGLSFEYIKLDTATEPPPTEPPLVVEAPLSGDPYVPGQTIDTTLLSGFEHGCVKPEGMAGALQNFSGFMGTMIQVGQYPLTVSALGRLCYPSNNGSHTLKLVNAATGEDVAGSEMTVSMANAIADQIIYGELEAPVTLEPNTAYYLLSSEKAGGDSFGDSCDNLFAASGAAINGYVYHDGESYQTTPFPNSSYVTLDMRYTYTPTAEIPENTEETDLFVGFKAGNLRNDYHSFIGIKFVTGSEPMLVTHLGRIYLAGNQQKHTLKLVDAETGLDVPGGSVAVYGGVPEEVTYVALESPVTLAPDHMYYLMSREFANGDQWYNNDAKFLVNYDEDCTLLGGAYLLFGYEDAIMLNQGFVGLNLKYQKALPEKITVPEETEQTEQAPAQTPTEPIANRSNGIPTAVVVAAVAVAAAAAVVLIVLLAKKKKNS